MQVSQPAVLSQGSVASRFDDIKNAGTIQFSEDMSLNFYLPVPLNKGCRITVSLPPEYSTNTIEYVGSLQVFGFYKEYTEADSTLTILSSS